MNKLLQFLKLNFFPILIITICGFLAWKNYVPNTILSGWDTLHPEFNFWLYFKRALNGVWVEHQGLGAVASQSHPAEIPKLLVLGILDIILPLNLVRYTYLFLCLTIGALGIYFFCKYILSVKWHKFVDASSFLASLFYIFNLTTVQQFYVPLEMFAVHYALVPWLFYLGYKYTRQPDKKTLLWFSVLTLFSSSMAHTATLFYVYLVSLGLFLVFINFKKAIFLCLITVLINSFWIFPNLYYIKNHSNEVSISKIHSNFTDEAFMQSQSFGDINNLSLSKNFLFNWREFDFEKGDFVDLLDEWKLHLEKNYVKEVGYVLFALSILGFFISLYFKSKPSIYLVLPFSLSVLFWINENPPFTNFFIYLRENFSLIKEGLRFPFTKFSMIYILVLSVWFGFSSRLIMDSLNKIKVGSVYLFLTVFAIFYFQLPQFHGYLISPSMKVSIPNNYFEVFKWFDNQNESARVAMLPMNSYWGWVYNDWGYQGAGFVWFGIKQPLLNREFDRWSLYNETFYNEASFALYNNDKESFKKVLEKYQVRYLLLDESIINAGGDKELLRLTEIKSLLQELGFSESFKSAFLTVFDTGILVNNISTVPSYVSIDADLNYSKIDIAYQKYGNYVSSEKGIGFPFVNFDKRGPVKIKTDNEYLEFVNTKTKSFIRLPISERKEESFNKESGFADAFNCDLKKSGEVGREQLQTGRKYTAINGGVSCDYFVFEDLKFDTSYTLHIKGQNLKGRSLKIYLYNWETKQVELEELLTEGKFDEYHVIYPKSKDLSETKNGLTSYTLNIETRSFGRIASENIVSKIEFIPFDINLLNNLYTESELNDDVLDSSLKINNITKFGTAIYKVETAGEGLLKLGQGYEQGWVSYPKLEHQKVNGWANGFKVKDDGVYYIFFWPQALQWFGFIVSLLTAFVLIVKSKSKVK